jgi:hypothetical protein
MALANGAREAAVGERRKRGRNMTDPAWLQALEGLFMKLMVIVYKLRQVIRFGDVVGPCSGS